MIEDWTTNYKPDLLTFVPYEWSFNIILRDFEMVWLGNQHNWIECNSNKQENGTLNTRFLCQWFMLKILRANFPWNSGLTQAWFLLQDSAPDS